MDVLIVLTTERSRSVLQPLLAALNKASVDMGLFFTNDGVRLASELDLSGFSLSSENTVVCHDSWARFGAGQACPLTSGSQTDHSRMIGEADRVISL